MMWFLFEAICWTLWINRNDFVFNNKLIPSPRAIVFKLLSFLQHYWMVATRGEGRRALEGLTDMIKAQVPMELTATGVG
jgi:hypothetical protein